MAQVNPAPRLAGVRWPRLDPLPIGAFVRTSGPAVALGLLTALFLQIIARLPGAAPLSPDAGPVSRVTWSAVVCLGLGLATAMMRRRVATMAIAGAVGAPLAFVLARATRPGSTGLLHALEGGLPSPVVLGAIKGIEYCCLGISLGVIGRRPGTGAATYLATGLSVGLVFGIANFVVASAASPSPIGLPSLLTWFVNEVFFPSGCALVVWVADRSRPTARLGRTRPGESE
jgi:hypothetical protein